MRKFAQCLSWVDSQYRYHGEDASKKPIQAILPKINQKVLHSKMGHLSVKQLETGGIGTLKSGVYL
ncbi:hypothetical protein ABE01_06900 [Bacillus paralicheniformis]|nr:hypothetical protein ACH97_213940 [Bacillus paralicheniformis]MBG9882058.1 hypothetical protein [Bacillus paralicheniformis]OMI14083.1 hypothetical protein BVL54_00720 [Bacillus paralicheniformis]PLC15342.1 hypothetical protein BV582_13745 [Bacillus paralicheniformis]